MTYKSYEIAPEKLALSEPPRCTQCGSRLDSQLQPDLSAEALGIATTPSRALDVRAALRSRLTPTESVSQFKAGDKVLILRKAKTRERGWENSWVGAMDNSVGKIGTVILVSTCLTYNIEVECDGETLGYPSFVLELVPEVPLQSESFAIDKMSWRPVPELGGFRVGDKVQVKAARNSETFSLVSAIVTAVEPEYVVVKTITGKTGSFYPSNLEFLPRKLMYGASVYKLAKEKAIGMAKEFGAVTADDVQYVLKLEGYNSTDLGNAAGAIFRSKDFEKTGTVRSTREGNRGRMIATWKYIGA